MLTAVKNNIKIMFISIKYNLMKSMANKVAFLTSVIMMIFNNATFIIQWLTIFAVKESIGSYTINDVMLFWAISSGSFGLAHILFNGIWKMPEYIENGKLDAYLTLPKNVLCSIATSSLEPSAIGDLIYGYIALMIFNFSIKNIILYTILIILGSLLYTSYISILSTLTFYFYRSSIISEAIGDVFLNGSLYPDVIFSRFVKIIFFTLIPAGLASWIPVHLIMDFHLSLFITLIIATTFFIVIAFTFFNHSLKRYSSSNLMGARS